MRSLSHSLLPLVFAAIGLTFFACICIQTTSDVCPLVEGEALPEADRCCNTRILTDTATGISIERPIGIIFDALERTKKRNEIIITGLPDTPHFNIEYCPCDSSFALIDTTTFTDEEREAVAASDATPEGNPFFLLPVPGPLDSKFHSQNATGATQDTIERDDYLKIAILDSGVDTGTYKKHKHEIAGMKEMFRYTTDITDTIGHGSVVFTLIDAQAKDLARYYIYKCLDREGISTAFRIACALRCAEKEEVDIINISMGGYTNSPLLSNVISSLDKRSAIIASNGNDCRVTDSISHYPSDYTRVFGISAINVASNADMRCSYPLWSCTNGHQASVNIGAPGKIEGVGGGISYGTSFAAAHTTGRFAMLLYSRARGNASNEFDATFLQHETFASRNNQRYLFAAQKCVDMHIIY